MLFGEASNPSGWYYASNGAQAGIKAIESLLLKATAQAENEAPAQSESASVRFNYQNLKALVSGGRIFSVEFVKRGNGELRKMVCRLGVTKHLKGGKSTYSAKSKGLLPVFDMDAKGYRSIPVDAIKRLTVGGQSFQFGEVAQ